MTIPSRREAKPALGPVVLGLDTGLASMGWCLAAMVGPSPSDLRVLDLGVWRSQPNAKKRGIKMGDDDFERTRELAHFLRGKMRIFQVAMLTTESFSPPRSSSVAAKMARCYGVLACLADEMDLPVAQASPQEIKKAVTGWNSASKEAVEQGVRQTVQANWSSLLDGIPASKYEHAFDAVGSIIACWNNTGLTALRQSARWRAA